MINPYFYGNPVPPATFLGRRREIRRVTARILQGGQSSAIVSDPRWGKTSLLRVLAAPERRDAIFGAEADRLLFSYFDVQPFGCGVEARQFWEQALRPLLVFDPGIKPDVDRALASPQDAQPLRDLLDGLRARGKTLVLLIDEFDTLVQCESLRKSGFFGVLRSVTTLSQGGLAIVSASRKSVGAMNDDTAELSGSASPFFNFTEEIPLKPFDRADVDALLARNGDVFDAKDLVYLRRTAGGHPYLLQAAASHLWMALVDAREEGNVHRVTQRLAASADLRQSTAPIFAATWKHWSPSRRRAFVTVALGQMPGDATAPDFDVTAMKDGLELYGPELREMETMGYLVRNDDAALGWSVTIESFLWWLADELARVVRDDKGFEDWVRTYHMDGVLTRGERDSLARATRGVLSVLMGCAAALVEAASSGLGGVLIGKVQS